MPGALAQALAEAGQPGAPISVRIDYVILGPNTGNGGGPAGSSPDQMVGSVIVGGVARPLRALTWYYPAASDAARFPTFARVRVLGRARILRDLMADRRSCRRVCRALERRYDRENPRR